jgi:RNA polymerase sigma-70 factor, ECF subfamily
MYETATLAAATTAADEQALVAALRAGDEAAFSHLLDRHHNTLIAVALHYVRQREVAEEVAQETWLAVLKGLDRFEARSSLKTWIFQILVNRAKTRAVREGRTIAMSALDAPDPDGGESAVDPERFLPPDHAQWPGHWASAPQRWDADPEARLLARETRAWIQEAVDALPENQRLIITLRDVKGWSAEEVCASLDISDGNQRVLLHRARSRVRAALERHFSQS